MSYRRGIVQEGRGGQVRVLFTDEDILSPWLDVGVAEARGGAMFTRPRPGNLVSVLLDERGETGAVVGAHFTDQDVPPGDADDVVVQVFADGTRIAYDEAAGTLSFSNAAGFAFSITGGELRFTGDLTIAGDLTVEGETTLAETTINGVKQVGS